MHHSIRPKARDSLPNKPARDSIVTINLNLIDWSKVEEELPYLRHELEQRATIAKHKETDGAVMSAEKALKTGVTKGTSESLKQAGKWALDVAMELGTNVAAEIL